MDPLSIAASIAGLVTLADIVVVRGRKFVSTAKHAEEEVKLLIDETERLVSTLKILGVHAARFEKHDSRRYPHAQVRNIEACFSTLGKIKAGLQSYDWSISSIERRFEKFRWARKKSDIEELLRQLERHKSSMQLAAQATSVSAILESLEGQSELRQMLAHLVHRSEDEDAGQLKTRLTEQRKRWLKLLTTVDSDAFQDVILGNRQPGTGIWFLEGSELRRWIPTLGSTLWVYGIPGAGKTTLMATLIQELRNYTNQDQALAFFYCNFKDPETHDPINILGSIVRQITLQNENCFTLLGAFYDKLKKPYDNNPRKATSRELCELIVGLSTNLQRVMIVVDGLDEITIERADVTRVLKSLNKPGGNISLLFSSRLEADLKYVLGSCPTVSIAAMSSDLQLYVYSEIERRIQDWKLRLQDLDLKEYITDTLIKKAEGMFRWVVCQMDYLCECTTDAERRDALTKLPPTLPASYDRILERASNSSNSRVPLLVERTLQWVYFSTNVPDHSAKEQRVHLSISALLEAIAVEDTDTDISASDGLTTENEVLHWSSSLLRISQSGRFEFPHYTVAEYLTALDPASRMGRYRLDKLSNYSYIVRVCLSYLSAETFRVLGTELTPTSIKSTVEYAKMKHPFLSFAAPYVPFLCKEDYLHHNETSRALFRNFFSYPMSAQFTLWLMVYWAPRGAVNDDIFKNAWTWLGEMGPLWWAVAFRLADIVKWLLEHKEEDVTLATHASSSGLLTLGVMSTFTIVNWLLTGPSFDFAEDENRANKYRDSETHRQADIVKILLQTGIRPDCASDILSCLPLAAACKSEDTRSVHLLLDAGAKFQKFELLALCNRASLGSSFVDELLSFKLSTFDDASHGALLWLCVSNAECERLVDIPLLNAIQPPDYRTDTVEWICMSPNKDLGKMYYESRECELMKDYSLVQLQSLQLPILQRVLCVFRTIIRVAVQRHLRKPIRTWARINERLLASIMRQSELQNTLILNAAAARSSNEDGRVEKKVCETVKLLIQLGESTIQCDKDQLTPLHYAVKRKSLRLLKILWDAQKDVAVFDMQDVFGNTPSSLAAQQDPSTGTLAFIKKKQEQYGEETSQTLSNLAISVRD